MGEAEFSIHGYNIVTLLKRLEAATSRLEDVTIFQEHAHQAGGAEAGQVKSTGGTTVAAVTAGASTSSPASAAPVLETPKAIKAYDDFIAEFVDPFVSASDKIDSVVGDQAELFKKAVIQERQFLWAASLSKKVTAAEPTFAEVLGPINETIGKVVEIKDSNRTSKFSNNLATVAEGVPVLGWICVDTPVSYIPDFKDSSQFWSNRILKEFKDKDEDQVAWARAFIKIFDGLKAFAKEYETTGPTWKPDGGDIREELKKVNGEVEGNSSAAAAAVAPPPPPPPSAGGPPPPPPPPPASVFEAKSEDAPSGDASSGGMNAVFSELNKGADITKGLRKVEKSQMTHKNPALRASSNVTTSQRPVPPKKPRSLSKKPEIADKPPKKELVDSKWVVTDFKESPNQQPIVLEVSMDQSVFIGNCESLVVQIKGKVNAVTINSCKKVGVVLDKGISSVDIIKSNHVELQIIDHVPTISADQSDSLTIYLSRTSLDTEIYTSSTTALNVEIPDGDDMKELAAPEQLRHVVDAKTSKLITTPVEHAG
ncbi:DEKNAAC100675 [Brettanomyces naardenensis]|uniref:Adenylyl cyclase-associated protein n=1 Tax=Brettanomyces naardenensis TaxID=13370 RepID=A0A448YGL0_BRENA|nr:DEKNAAC100675 [Brettanomyces naardenensis]